MLSKTLTSKPDSRENSLPLVTLTTGGTFLVPQKGARYLINQSDGELSFTFQLTHPESRVEITGLVEATTEPKLSITIEHLAPHTQAQTEVRTLATGTAKPQFNGCIIIAPNAKDSQSYLNHHSLVLDQASSQTHPALEIQTDQVKCSHAATIKTITDKDLFYPLSRGLSRDTARQLLIDAFLQAAVI